MRLELIAVAAVSHLVRCNQSPSLTDLSKQLKLIRSTRNVGVSPVDSDLDPQVIATIIETHNPRQNRVTECHIDTRLERDAARCR